LTISSKGFYEHQKTKGGKEKRAMFLKGYEKKGNTWEEQGLEKTERSKQCDAE